MYALITGASSGLGKEFAYALAEKGYDVILVSRSIEKLEEVSQKIKEKYARKVLIFPFDLGKRESFDKLFEDTKELDIEVVINNAGLGKVGMFNEISDNDDYAMIDINVTAMHMILKHYADVMKQGYILSVASIAAFVPGPKMATYYATKNYILAYAEAIRFELKKMKKDVSVTILCPGPVNTNFNSVANVNFSLHGISPEKCTSYALKRLFKKKKLALPTFTVRSASRLLRVVPHRLSMNECYKMQKKKESK